MGQNYTDYVEYECGYDCMYPDGCPGHKMRLVSCRSSDTLYIEIDGKDYAWFSDDSFGALLKLTKEGVKWR